MSTKTKLGRSFRARATKQHFALLPTEVPIPFERRNPVPDLGQDGMRWYVCTTAPQQERRAADSLRRETERLASWGLPPFVPYVPCDTFWQARKRGSLSLPRREVQRPVARSYAFLGVLGGLRPAHLNVMSERNVENHNRHGLIAVLGSRDGIPISLPEGDVAFLSRMARAELDALKSYTVEDGPTYAEGEAINVVDGAFTAHGGKVLGVDQQQKRLLIELQIFGRATPIELDFGQVAKAA